MDLFPTPANPAPPDAIVTPVRTADDLLLRVVRWVPQGEPLGTVVVIQGRTEFIEKYFEVAGELLARGFVVVAMDWRGQGLSDRDLNNSRKGHVDDFAFSNAISTRCINRCCNSSVRSHGLRSAIPWAGRSCWRRREPDARPSRAWSSPRQ